MRWLWAAASATVCAAPLAAQTAPAIRGTIVVLGSSTAEGVGPKQRANAWVARLSAVLKSRRSSCAVVNLAKSGYTTWRVLPEGPSGPPERALGHPERTPRPPERTLGHPERSEGSGRVDDRILRSAQDDEERAHDDQERVHDDQGRAHDDQKGDDPVHPSIDPLRNVTRALTYTPALVIVNLPSNDAVIGTDPATQMTNFRAIADAVTRAGSALLVTTTQPRNLDARGLAVQTAMRDSLRAAFGDDLVDFWTGLATPEGRVQPRWDSGDGIHLNDAAHEILFDRAFRAARRILSPAGVTAPCTV